MKFLFLFFLLPFINLSQELNKKPLTIGETIAFKSEILNESRILNIYLPQGYSTDSIQKHYPVIYVLDGTITEDFLHIVGIVQFGSYPWVNIIQESIVVGIANTDRKRDFTFTPKNEAYKKEFPTSGGSQKFIECLEKEIQPIIEQNFRVTENKTIIGQSLGGLLATEILLKKPDLFDQYIIISPSLWWDDESLLDFNPTQCQSKKSIYVAVGKEGKIMEGEAKAIYKKLLKHSDKYSDVYFEMYKNQDHGNILHLAVYNAFLKLFADNTTH